MTAQKSINMCLGIKYDEEASMRYYCKECNSVIELGKKCPKPDLRFDCVCNICKRLNSIIEIPVWETPQAYKERTGKEWQGAVWYREMFVHKDEEEGWLDWEIVNADEINWMTFEEPTQFLCASQPCAPPDDFVMEVNND